MAKDLTTDNTPTDEIAFENEDADVSHVATSDNPFTWNNAKKAYGAGIVAVTGAAGGLTVTQFIQNGGVDVHALGVEALALAGLFAVTFIGAWLPKNSSK